LPLRPSRASASTSAPSLCRWGLAAGLLAGSLLLTGCSTRFIRGRAERRITDRLEELIGPADEYRVRVRRTKDGEIVVGRINQIDIDARHVRAGQQIELETVHLALRNVRYHAPPEERVSVGSSELVIHLTEAALNDYLRRQHPNSQPVVHLNDGTVTLKGTLRLLGLPTPIETEGRLEVVERTRLEFRASSVRLAIDPIPGIGREYVENQLNPLVNVARLKLPLRLDSVQIQCGRMIVRGAAYLPPPSRSQ
jgi:hypothetical protein